MDLEPGRFRHGAHEGDHGAFAVSAGHMDHRRQFVLGIIKFVEEPLDPAEGQVDDPGMKPVEPLNQINGLRQRALPGPDPSPGLTPHRRSRLWENRRH